MHGHAQTLMKSPRVLRSSSMVWTRRTILCTLTQTVYVADSHRIAADTECQEHNHRLYCVYQRSVT
jgi:hypothetical protein